MELRAPAGPVVQLVDGRCLDGEAALRSAARRLRIGNGRAHVSRSYRYPYALVAWHDDQVGVDIERLEPCGPDFASTICTPAELARLGCPDALELISLWCAKEALSKALGDALRYDPRRLEAPSAWPGGRSGPWRATELQAPDGHVAWLCWRSAHERADPGLTEAQLRRPEVIRVDPPPPRQQ